MEINGRKICVLAVDRHVSGIVTADIEIASADGSAGHIVMADRAFTDVEPGFGRNGAAILVESGAVVDADVYIGTVVRPDGAVVNVDGTVVEHHSVGRKRTAEVQCVVDELPGIRCCDICPSININNGLNSKIKCHKK